MNIERAKLPWQRRYNWGPWVKQLYRACKDALTDECRRHKKAAYLITVSLIVGLVVYIGNHLLELYVEMHDSIYHARAESAQAMALRMSGAPKTPEDVVVFKEPVGWKMALNWCRAGWQEECR